MMEVYELGGEAETRALGAELGSRWQAGDLVLLTGELGAGKTTFVRGVLQGLGYLESVRSPTFNLLQAFPTDPPVLHADLYRLGNAAGLGLEDYFDTHLCLIEWPDRLGDLIDPESTYRIQIAFTKTGRRVTLAPPSS